MYATVKVENYLRIKYKSKVKVHLNKQISIYVEL